MNRSLLYNDLSIEYILFLPRLFFKSLSKTETNKERFLLCYQVKWLSCDKIATCNLIFEWFNRLRVGLLSKRRKFLRNREPRLATAAQLIILSHYAG